MNKTEYYSKSDTETELIAYNIACSITTPMVFAFKGDLGSGKTCFSRGFAKGIGFTGVVNSPTFSIVNEYAGGRLTIYHFDMFRISSWDDLYSTCFFDYIDDNVLLVEWSENVLAALPENTVYITIEKINENERKIIIEGLE